jgi:ABC-type lipoprotein export system ATPase subunit
MSEPSRGQSPLVVVRGVTRAFEEGRVVALAGVDFVVHRGEFVAVTGPSGSGKTTLLNLIGAMDVPDAGEVMIDGVRLDGRATLDRVRAEKIGFVFQMHNLIPVLSARENIEVAMMERGVPRRERTRRARDLLDQVGLLARADSDVRGLSGGERQRVAVARAMANEPPLLLADEPTGNLDSKTGAEVMRAIHALRMRTGAALVLVTHNEALCAGADRHLRMQDGRMAGDERTLRRY